MESMTLGIVGGSGLYELRGLQDRKEIHLDTPYGPPSDVLLEGRLPLDTAGHSVRLVFLPRHGRGHRLSPSAVNYRANICALKMAGVTHVLAVSAVGSMQEHIAPGDMVIVDQFIDLTKRRVSSFFDDGIAAHVGFADPVCADLASRLAEATDRAVATTPLGDGVPKPKVHRGGTYVCMEGPQFSTRAESLVYRSWNVSVIGMTAMPEAKLAREAELPYATLALATDYDCWHESEEDVTVEAVLEVMARNITVAQNVVRELSTHLPDPTKSRAHGAVSKAIMTAPERISPEARRKLAWLLG